MCPILLVADLLANDIHTYIRHYHHHVVPRARISLILSRHFSLSFIAYGRSSGLHPVSSHSCCMYVRAGHPAFAWPYVGVHRSTSLMSSSLLLQQCPACLFRLAWIVFVIGGRWPYSWCLVGCCCQDLFNDTLFHASFSHHTRKLIFRIFIDHLIFFKCVILRQSAKFVKVIS